MARVPRQRWRHDSSSRVAAALLLGLAAVGCEAFDPVKSEDLCTQSGAISANCAQCQGDRPAANCPQCQEGDPSRCSPVQPENPVQTDPDGNGAAGGPHEGHGPDQAGEAGTPDVSTGGRGQQEEASGSDGSDGMPAAGQGGNEPPPSPSEQEIEDKTPGCQSDGDCMRNFPPETPYCDTETTRCEPCLIDDHCAGTMLQHCDPKSHRCENCVSDGDCPGMRCEPEQHICVECTASDQCTTDPTNNQCDLDKWTCVDCLDDHGCMDPTPACDTTLQKCFTCLDGPGADYCKDPIKHTCDPETRECVDCLDNSGCDQDGANETCDMDNKVCVDCYRGKGCRDPEKAVCDGKTCVQCLGPSDCDTRHCLDKECVECEVDNDCGSRNAARCSSSSHTCEPCNDDSDCEHLDGTQECDSGRCVECKDDNGGHCGDNACLLASKTCSDQRKSSVDVCRECVADAACKEGMKCASLKWGSRSLGDFCVYASASRGCAARRPYSQSLSMTSIDGAEGTYCVPPMSTTCEGVLDASRGKDCSANGAEDCGVDGAEDGDCPESKKCTYGCTDPEDCPSGSTCQMNLKCG